MRLADEGSERGSRSPARTTDWRERTPIKGGPAVHTVARSGWGFGAAFGAVATPSVTVLAGALAGSTVGAVVVALFVLAVAGAVPGAVLGVLAQHGARSWLLAPTDEESRAAQRTEARADRLDASDLLPSGRWAHLYRACASPVEAFHELVEAAPPGRTREWLTDIGGRLDDELAEALRLARLGQRMDGDEQGAHDQAQESIVEQLSNAETDFAATRDRASAIVLEESAETDFHRMHAELDMLADQAPQLRSGRQD